MSLRDELLASLKSMATQPNSSPIHNAVLRTIAEKANEVTQPRPIHQSPSTRKAYDEMMRRRHYIDQSSHLIAQGITTNAYGQELDSDTTTQMMVRREVPTKKQGKKTKMTRSTPSSFNAAALKGVPGASRTGRPNMPAMMWSEDTGTLVVDDLTLTNHEARTLMARLSRSSKNCDTTRSNYIV